MLNKREDELGRLILKLSHQIVKNRSRNAQAMGLTASQTDCLLFFSSRQEASVTQLKDYLGVTHQTAQGLVQRMTSKKLLNARRSPQDSRVVLVSLSQQGRDLSEQLARSRSNTVGHLLQGISPQEEELLLQLLERMYRSARDTDVSPEEVQP